MKLVIKQKSKETRRDYLLRVAMAFLENSWEVENNHVEIEWDKAIGDSACLAEDIRIELN